MRNINVYVGNGAYQAKDVECFLAVFGFDYRRVCEHDLTHLDPGGILIIPGGKIGAYLPAWGQKGIRAIRSFVAKGGIYVGICAGAYVAGKKYENSVGLGFYENSLARRKRNAVIDVCDNKGNRWQMITENGPDLTVVTANKTLLTSLTGHPEAVMVEHGRGKVFLFASHPEGSINYNLAPSEFSGGHYFSRLLKRLIRS